MSEYDRLEGLPEDIRKDAKEPKPVKRKRGRPKGSLSMRTRVVIDLLEDKNFEPVEHCLYLYKRALQEMEQAHPDQRPIYLKIATDQIKDLMTYVYPKRKAQDPDPRSEDGKTLTDVIKSLTKEVKK